MLKCKSSNCKIQSAKCTSTSLSDLNGVRDMQAESKVISQKKGGGKWLREMSEAAVQRREARRNAVKPDYRRKRCGRWNERCRMCGA